LRNKIKEIVMVTRVEDPNKVADASIISTAERKKTRYIGLSTFEDEQD